MSQVQGDASGRGSIFPSPPWSDLELSCGKVSKLNTRSDYCGQSRNSITCFDLDRRWCKVHPGLSLRRFKSDRDEIWHHSSLSKYASIHVGILI